MTGVQKKRRLISEHFKALPDPRLDRTKRHVLQDMVVIAICGVLCGADNWVAIEQFGNAKLDWFRRFLRLPNGIPSHDTFGRTFAALDSDAFASCFAAWVRAIAEISEDQIIAIDGKTLRRSFDKASSRAAIHMVSAWASENKMVLGQVKTEEKSNEITAIPQLLKLLEIEGCIVTIDAMGCQKKIAANIVNKKANYVLALKGNQETLSREVEELFAQAETKNSNVKIRQSAEKVEIGHGRIEQRRYSMIGKLDTLSNAKAWEGLRSVGMVESVRIYRSKVSTERRYYKRIRGSLLKLCGHTGVSRIAFIGF